MACLKSKHFVVETNVKYKLVRFMLQQKYM